MARFLVHSATGPENPTRAALALLVARTAAAEGHDVAVSKARGIEAPDWAQASPPEKLVELAVWAETALTY